MSNIRPVKKFPWYYISDTGDVYSRLERVRGSNRGEHKLGDQLSPLKKDGVSGRYQVTLFKKGIRYRFKVAHLVLEAFIARRPKGKIGCHRDGDPFNNSAVNLYWGTYKTNAEDRERHGRTYHPYGELHRRAKFNDKQIRVIRWANVIGTPRKILAEMCSVELGAIGKIIRGERWKHIK